MKTRFGEWMVEYMVWNAKVENIDIEVWQTGEICIDAAENRDLYLDILTLNEFLEEANRYISARKRYIASKI